jgi:hypothetical protein
MSVAIRKFVHHNHCTAAFVKRQFIMIPVSLAKNAAFFFFSLSECIQSAMAPTLSALPCFLNISAPRPP